MINDHVLKDLNRIEFTGGSNLLESRANMSKTTNKYSSEVRARAVRVVLKSAITPALI